MCNSYLDICIICTMSNDLTLNFTYLQVISTFYALLEAWLASCWPVVKALQRKAEALGPCPVST